MDPLEPLAPTTSRVRRIAEVVFISLFLGIVCLPLVGKLLPSEGAFALTENRRPTAFPTVDLNSPGWGFSIASFPRRFERYWDDSFAFRWYLIRAHSIVKLALGVSPSPKALVGQNGYLFYAAEQSVDYFRAVKPYTARELTQWREELESRRVWLAERGIRYLVVVAPNKETIYPEFMPPELRPVGAETRLDQLTRELRAHSGVELLDLRPALRRAKQTQRIYHRTDTHWNDAGASVAYGEILARLHPWFPELNAATLPGSLVVHNTSGGDLARILALDDRFREERIDFLPTAPQRARKVAGSNPGESDVVAMECADCGGPRVVMTQDSFNTNLAPLLAEHFSRIVFVDGTRLDRSLIDRERPALVIQEFVERILMCPSMRGC
jgi:alginate O-acetyltransferase complex protein AlgJ